MKNFIATATLAATMFGLAACPNNSNDVDRPYWRHQDMNTEALQNFAENLWYSTSQGDWKAVYNFSEYSFQEDVTQAHYVAVKRTCFNNLSSKTFKLIDVTVAEDNNPTYGYSTVESNDGSIVIQQEYKFDLEAGQWKFIVDPEEDRMFRTYSSDEYVQVLVDNGQCFIP